MDAVTTLPRSRPLTRDDLAAAPDDGHRYELVDGILVVTPAPGLSHQTVALRLAGALEAARPSDLRVLTAPFDVVLAADTVVQPDLLVARRTDLTARDLPVPPLLAVEILWPSTRRIDLTLKRSRYEAAGVGAYWVVDPDEPSLVAWELQDSGYVEVGRVSDDEAFHAQRPFEVTLVCADLAADR